MAAVSDVIVAVLSAGGTGVVLPIVKAFISRDSDKEQAAKIRAEGEGAAAAPWIEWGNSTAEDNARLRINLETCNTARQRAEQGRDRLVVALEDVLGELAARDPANTAIAAARAVIDAVTPPPIGGAT